MAQAIVTEKLLKKALQKEGTISELEIKNLCSEGENFASDLLEVNFNFSNEDHEDVAYNFVVKYPNKESFLHQSVAIMNGYKKETMMFHKLIPDATNWQQKRFGEIKYQIPVPKVIYCDEETDLIIMENLSKSNFLVEPRQIGKNFEQCKALMKCIAEFHAILLAYVQSFTSDEEFFEKYPYARNSDKAMFKAMLEHPDALAQKEQMISPILNAIKSAAPLKKDLVDKYLKHILTKALAKNTYMSIFPNEEFNVICHGDLWNNNVMFSKDDSGEIKNCKLVDLQLYKYCSPAVDLTHFLFVSAAMDVIVNHRKELLEVYYEAFKKAMKEMESDVKFTFDGLYAHLEGFYDAGLQNAVMSASMMFAPKDKIVKANIKDADENPLLEFSKQIEKLLENIDESLLERLISLLELGEQLNLY